MKSPLLTYSIIAAMLLGAFALAWTAVAQASISFAVDTKVNSYEVFDFFTATTTTATSTNISGGGGSFTIAGAKAVTFYFTHGGTATTSTATSTFSVQVQATPAGDWYDYQKLVTGTSSAAVASVPIAGATSTVNANMSTLGTDAFYAARCIVNEGSSPFTSGEHTCSAAARY